MCKSPHNSMRHYFRSIFFSLRNVRQLPRSYRREGSFRRIDIWYSSSNWKPEKWGRILAPTRMDLPLVFQTEWRREKFKWIGGIISLQLNSTFFSNKGVGKCNETKTYHSFYSQIDGINSLLQKELFRKNKERWGSNEYHICKWTVEGIIIPETSPLFL